MNSSPGDQQLLMDYVSGNCDQPMQDAVRQRLGSDSDFAAEHEAIRRTLGLLDAWQAPEPAANLTERTMARVRAMRRTEDLLTQRPMQPRARAPMFTLRELGALAAAAVLIMAIVIPSLRQARLRSEAAMCNANIGQIGAGLQHYASANNEFLPALPNVEGASWLPRSDGRQTSNSASIFKLVQNRLAPVDAFQCPGVGVQSVAMAEGMTDFPSRKAMSYSWQYSMGQPIRRDDPQLLPVARQMAILADSNPVFADGRFHPERLDRATSDNHGGQGQNVLFLDMHTQWATTDNVGVNGDNIWLIDGVRDYTGAEKPARTNDSFLLPYAGQ